MSFWSDISVSSILKNVLAVELESQGFSDVRDYLRSWTRFGFPKAGKKSCNDELGDADPYEVTTDWKLF
jgi:hypothetical protein